MSVIDVLGYSAALAVLAAFCMSSIIPLRILAVLSNVLFASYGLLAHLYPCFCFMGFLPINLLKLAPWITASDQRTQSVIALMVGGSLSKRARVMLRSIQS